MLVKGGLSGGVGAYLLINTVYEFFFFYYYTVTSFWAGQGIIPWAVYMTPANITFEMIIKGIASGIMLWYFMFKFRDMILCYD